MAGPLGIGVLTCVLLSAAPSQLRAQEAALVQECAQIPVDPVDDARRFCNLVAQGIEMLQPRLGLALTGGNPVPGTASTLGMRIGTLPRLSLGGRVTGVWTDLPPIRELGDTEQLDFLLPAINGDGSIGIFGGFSPAPTLGGLASVDALVSAGLLPLPGGEGFDTGVLFGWGLGARVGILRESFTVPGISVSAMYRNLGDVTFGDPALAPGGAESFFDYGLSGISLRGAVSKRLFTVGVTVGGGYDSYSSDVAFGILDPFSEGAESEFRFNVDGFDSSRLSAFANVSWTLLILHVVGELGWQAGGERVPAALPADVDLDPEDGAWFGSLAVRLSI